MNEAVSRVDTPAKTHLVWYLTRCPRPLSAARGLTYRWNVPSATITLSFAYRWNVPSATILHHDPIISDYVATTISVVVVFFFLRLWQETAKRGLFDPKLNRKLVHITIGLVLMLCWPLFGTDRWGSYFAASIMGVNVFRMLAIGLGIWKDEATVKSMSRFGDYRELLRGPLYYSVTITLASIIYWRNSPISIAAICNLCAGDGMADVVGRRFGAKKLPYNKNKSYAGSIAMASFGFLASIGYMWYFSSFGFMEGSWKKVISFLVVSVISAVVESLPISTDLDDNLTVALTSILVGSLVF
ncbi:probable phytol kinase 3, chloroplastic [Trifolium pratense]|uniref:probable phytol kinase 3, chloroplastic n=1 Tax=Trifolium pratense TaxID=57577 RepID=UPI001E697AF8|nr:probable phytol kinase 3, chloroplastic [Trifolium pratense]